MRTRKELNSLLGEQLDWLRASAAAFDSGEVSEAKRIAVIVRALVHDTEVSKSLLTQLGLRDRMTWLSVVASEGEGFAGQLWTDDPSEPGFRPRPGWPEFECDFAMWWRGPILTHNNEPISRAWFVLHAANFDGGAHVDPTLPDTYRSITREGGLRPVRINSAGDSYPDSTDPTPFALRTICGELATSVLAAW